MSLAIAACLIVPAAGLAVLLMAQLLVNRSIVQMFEHVPPLNAVERAPDPDREVVAFETADGLTLSGSLLRPARGELRGLILFCHEVSGNQWSARSYAEGLLNAGFAVFAFDFRNHGQSESKPGYEPLHWLSDYELEDARSALRYIESRPDLSELPLGLFGISRGGAAAIALAAETDAFDCTACDGAYTTNRMMRVYAKRWASLLAPSWAQWMLAQWHVDLSLFFGRMRSEFRRGVRYVRLEKSLRNLAGSPVFLISGQRDSYVLPEISESIRKTLGPDATSLWLVPRARHNQAREIATAEYDQKLVAFFERHLAAPPIFKAPYLVRSEFETGRVSARLERSDDAAKKRFA